MLEDEVQENMSQGYPTSSGSTYIMFSITMGQGSPLWKVRERCQPGDGSQLRCNIFSVIGENQLSEWGSLLVLQPLPVKLWTFTGEVIEGLLQGAPMTALFLDSVIVTGKTQVEYKNNLQEDLTRLSDAGLTLKEAKCEFCLMEVQYLGYQVSSRGLELLAQRIQPVMDALASTGAVIIRS